MFWKNPYREMYNLLIQKNRTSYLLTWVKIVLNNVIPLVLSKICSIFALSNKKTNNIMVENFNAIVEVLAKQIEYDLYHIGWK